MGVQVLIWAGDTDYICNYGDNFQAANSLVSEGQAEFF